MAWDETAGFSHAREPNFSNWAVFSSNTVGSCSSIVSFSKNIHHRVALVELKSLFCGQIFFITFIFFVFRDRKQSWSWRPRWNRKFERKHYHLVITTRNAWLIFENRNQREQNIRQRWYCQEIWQRLNCILPRKHLSLASCFFYQFRDLISSISSIFELQG